MKRLSAAALGEVDEVAALAVLLASDEATISPVVSLILMAACWQEPRRNRGHQTRSRYFEFAGACKDMVLQGECCGLLSTRDVCTKESQQPARPDRHLVCALWRFSGGRRSWSSPSSPRWALWSGEQTFGRFCALRFDFVATRSRDLNAIIQFLTLAGIVSLRWRFAMHFSGYSLGPWFGREAAPSS